MSSRQRHQPRPLAHPTLWPSWLLWGALWLLARLPVGWLTRLGRVCGAVFWRWAPRRRHIATRNIELCLPELSPAAQQQLARSSVVELGVAAMETLWTWLGNHGQDPRFEVHGLQHYEAAHAEGRGVILLGMHLMSMDIIAPKLAQCLELDVIYRYSKNPVVERAMVRGRGRYFPRVIEREDTRAILGSLRAGRTIWYAADQDYGARHSVFANFFGVPAATINGTARLARFQHSAVVPFYHYRHPATGTWSLHFEAALTDYPSDDPAADATRTNAIIEHAIRAAPEQYLWVHKRFKTRPPGAAPVY